MTLYLKQKFSTVLLLLLIAIFINCAGSDCEIKACKEIFNELSSQTNTYWNQRTDSKSLDKAEHLVLKILQDNPIDFDNIDNLDVDIIVCLIVPYEETENHLALLSNLSEILDQLSNRKKLRRISCQKLLQTV